MVEGFPRRRPDRPRHAVLHEHRCELGEKSRVCEHDPGVYCDVARVGGVCDLLEGPGAPEEFAFCAAVGGRALGGGRGEESERGAQWELCYGEEEQ